MDIGLNSEQLSLRDTVRGILRTECPPDAARQAFLDMKYGVRIHWGLYSMLPVSRESWTFLGMSDAERQQYLESYKKWNPKTRLEEKLAQLSRRSLVSIG